MNIYIHVNENEYDHEIIINKIMNMKMDMYGTKTMNMWTCKWTCTNMYINMYQHVHKHDDNIVSEYEHEREFYWLQEHHELHERQEYEHHEQHKSGHHEHGKGHGHTETDMDTETD